MHHHPGVIALQTGKGSNKTLFPFPVVTDSALRQISETGIGKELPVDILPVDLNGQKLETGQSLTTSLWIRGPETLGAHSIALYFYYEAPSNSDVPRNHQYRMVKCNFVMKVIGSVGVTATRSRPCLHDNNLCQTVLVAVNNTSAAAHTQQQVG